MKSPRAWENKKKTPFWVCTEKLSRSTNSVHVWNVRTTKRKKGDKILLSTVGAGLISITLFTHVFVYHCLQISPSTLALSRANFLWYLEAVPCVNPSVRPGHFLGVPTHPHLPSPASERAPGGQQSGGMWCAHLRQLFLITSQARENDSATRLFFFKESSVTQPTAEQR